MGWIKRPGKNRAQRFDNCRRRRMEVYNQALWRSMRQTKLREKPICEVCALMGRISPGMDIHHLVSFTSAASLAERDAIAFDPANLLTVCDSCHQALHHGELKGCRSLQEIEDRLFN